MQVSSSIPTRKGKAGQILEYATSAAATMQNLAQVSGVPFLQTAVSASLLVLNEIQMTKMNQGMLLPIAELIHQLLSTIIHLCVANEGVLPLKLLGNIGHFAQTLQNFQNSLKLQQELGRIKRFIRHHELSTQLQTYETELQAIADEFKIRNGATMAAELIEFELDAQQRHQELMAVLAAQNDRKSEYSYSLRGSVFRQSNGVFSVLPPLPKIFHGRDAELAQLVTSFSQDEPTHMAILGLGGMGKTTLAIAALHHPEIISKYDRRHFISCESALEKNQLVRIIGDHLGLEPSKQLLKAIIGHFSECGSVLLVLDNLETTWEPVEYRAEVEDLLSLLSELPQLGLLITMRGAERPSKVRWTRPFLPPLDPLPPAASRQTVVEIADDPSSDEESHLAELLDLSGHLPLAVNIMANVASYEGYSKTLLRWKTEKTALLSDGSDQRSNLETSISISLSSPRMLSSTHVKELLSLLSLLPDGLSDVDLLSHEAVDIPNILQCRATLFRTSLAYTEHGRLKALSPIREYIKHVHSPGHERVERLRRYWDTLLELWKSLKELPSKELILRLISNLGNIDSVTQFVLSRALSGADRQRLMCSILSLDLFSQTILKSESPLAQHVVDHIHSRGDRRLHWQQTCSSLDLRDYHNLSPVQAEFLIRQGTEYYDQEEDPASEAEFSEAAAGYYYLTEHARPARRVRSQT
ncbi:P-loop containing nucleoside triphosphate hydrolase protein [Mycena epipterygia]|nr:P-loop containing nucleoside triphosphate hydrolase protein [Mycena epipterygia]